MKYDDEITSASPPVSPELLMQEYATIVAKMGGNESWAYSFVALYFAFLASIGAACAYLFSSNASIVSESTYTAYGVLKFMLPTLAMLLNVWAIGMVLDYKQSARVLNSRLRFIEEFVGLSSIGPESIGGSAPSQKKGSLVKRAQGVVVGSVMIMFFAPWIALAYFSV